MAKFKIEVHDRLQEWVAEEKGYFKAEGLDYEFVVDKRSATPSSLVSQGESEIRRGATEFLVEERGGDVSCACHWAVDIAASSRHGKLWPKAYMVAPGAVYVRPESSATKIEDLAGVEIAVGHRSGSHFSALERLEPFLGRDRIRLTFKGRRDMRLENLLEGKDEAANIIGFQVYLAEQRGMRKILDASFIVGFLVGNETPAAELEKYFRALRKAQRDIDIDPSPYKHYYLNHLKEPLKSLADYRAFGPGERIIFEPYTREMYDRAVAWMSSWGLNAEMVGKTDYRGAAYCDS
ncbi:MAG TPA: ABC transporter substrate-binding protein [Candidatus Binatia bacterium]|jgi:NitT/TauT family transport system substrate-binding protein